MMIEIWHNPRCSKSRQVLKILEDAGSEVAVRRYLDDPPSVAELDRILTAIGADPEDIVRWREPVADELGLKGRVMARTEWLQVLVAHPILIERPIVRRADGAAVLGRPPENVTTLL